MFANREQRIRESFTYAEHEAVDVGHRADVRGALCHFLLGREVLARDVELAEERQLDRDAVLYTSIFAHATESNVQASKLVSPYWSIASKTPGELGVKGKYLISELSFSMSLTHSWASPRRITTNESASVPL